MMAQNCVTHTAISKAAEKYNVSILVDCCTKVENIIKGFSCKSIRNDEGYWQSVEEYFESHNVTEFSHTVCDKCAEKLYGEEKWFKLRKKK